MAEQHQGPADTAGLRALLDQHAAHCRHLETERYWFMNVYAVIVGGLSGLMAYLRSMSATGLPEGWIHCFVVALTLFGLLVTIRWTYAFEIHRARADRAADALGEFARDARPGLPFLRMGSMPLLLQWVQTKYLFPAFYVAVLLGLALFGWKCDLIPWGQAFSWVAFGLAVVAGLLWFSALRRGIGAEPPSDGDVEEQRKRGTIA